MFSSRRAKSFLVAVAFLTGTGLLTACQGEDTASADTSASTGSSTAVPAQKKAKPTGVSGTFADGVVEYLAPDKYLVSTGDRDQQFWVSRDTKVHGAGTICGKAGASGTECTLEELEKVLKGGSVPADVVLKDGIATTITERQAPDEGAPVEDPEPVTEGIGKGKGVNGTWFGSVTRLAPGKYIVTGPGGEAQQFFVGEDTRIWGSGDICGDEDAQAVTACTEAQLEAAAKGPGVSAEVVIANGIATTITDDH
ncbi:hypothetical protein V1L54_05085 [Streptomyces sp. TRM 70361]|uniref:hypothetical protein n=1 Tax=Streptomyces sp. TRM 70361 TaxID=3116553 RepID=UPI002E7B0C51|nr:hypothetical protein [Streptomyces sp. TRM 70361]MEE1938791.1 hypothetical protein [Streptomyces sp. TRM 70361]